MIINGKKLWTISFGIDIGDAESGPLVNDCMEIISADSSEDAEKIWMQDAPTNVCGWSVSEATEEEWKEYQEYAKWLGEAELLAESLGL